MKISFSDIGNIVMKRDKARESLFHDMRNHLSRTSIDIVFDVGANTGQTASKIRKNYPECMIFSFEPVKKTFSILEQNFISDDLTRCYNIALGLRDQETFITANGTSTTNKIVDEQEYQKAKKPLESVFMKNGEKFCQDEGIKHISLLKIDTEGHDLSVLRGFAGMLAEQKIDIIQVEAGMNPTNRRHVPFSEFIIFFGIFDYYLFHIYEQVFEKKEPILRRTNPVFISRETARSNLR